MRSSRISVVLFACCVSVAAHAITYNVPSDRELIQKSDDIVIVTGVSSVVEHNEQGGIVTRYTLRIDEVLKGDHREGDEIVLTQRGGRIGDKMSYFPGTPEYEPGMKYLVFTETNRAGEPTTLGMGLGQFRLMKAQGRRYALRADIRGFDQNLEAHVEKSRDAEGLLEYIRGIVDQSIAPDEDYFVENSNVRWDPYGPIASNAVATRGSYLFRGGGNYFRWNNPAASILRNGTVTGADGAAGVTVARNQWNGTDSDIAYSDGGVDNTANGGLSVDDGKNTVLFNDPNNEVTGASGSGGISNAIGTHSLDGQTFWTIVEVDVVMNDQSFTQNCFNSVVVHEVGHTLGFRHADQFLEAGDVCFTGDAIMKSTVNCAWNGVLFGYDKDAASVVYGDGPSIESPTSFTAAATSTSNVNLSWTAVGGASTYNVYRSTNGDCYALAGTTAMTTFSDGGRTANTSYLYRVRAVTAGGEESGDSDIELATTTIFTDDPLVAGTTVAQTEHITELRTAVNAVRALAGLSASTFTDATLTAEVTLVKAVHVTELRTALDAARSALGLAAISYGESITATITTIKASHVTELRNGVK